MLITTTWSRVAFAAQELAGVRISVGGIQDHCWSASRTAKQCSNRFAAAAL